MKIEETNERIRQFLTPEQTAKFLILMEKFQNKKEFSVFSLWNIREIKQQNVIKKSINFNNNLTVAKGGPDPMDENIDGEVANG